MMCGVVGGFFSSHSRDVWVKAGSGLFRVCVCVTIMCNVYRTSIIINVG